jgi:hypothetical protein
MSSTGLTVYVRYPLVAVNVLHADGSGLFSI